MMRSLFSGVSGLKNHQTRMDVIGNNISNVNTTGYKSSRVNFTDMLSQNLSGASSPNGNIGGTNPKQIGLGSAVGAVDMLFTNGSVQSTGVNTDLALSSTNALFILNTGSGTAYTRNGDFQFDADGNYVQAGNGYFVQGWMANNGSINTNSDVTNIQIPSGKSMKPMATTTATYTNNLSVNEPTIVSMSGGTNKKTYTSPTDGAVMPSSTMSAVLTLTDGREVVGEIGTTYRVGAPYDTTKKTYTSASDGSVTPNEDTRVTLTLSDGTTVAGTKGVEYTVGGTYSATTKSFSSPEDGSATANGPTQKVSLVLSDGTSVDDAPAGTYTVGGLYSATTTTHDTPGEIVAVSEHCTPVTANLATAITMTDPDVSAAEVSTKNPAWSYGYTTSDPGDSATVTSKQQVLVSYTDGDGETQTLKGTMGTTYVVGQSYETAKVTSGNDEVSGSDEMPLLLYMKDGTIATVKNDGHKYKIGGEYTYPDVTPTSTSTIVGYAFQYTVDSLDVSSIGGGDGTSVKVGGYAAYTSSTVGDSVKPSPTNKVTVTLTDGTIIPDLTAPNPATTSGLYTVGRDYQSDMVISGSITAKSNSDVLLTLENGTTHTGKKGETYEVGKKFTYKDAAGNTVESKIEGFQNVGKIASLKEQVEIASIVSTEKLTIESMKETDSVLVSKMEAGTDNKVTKIELTSSGGTLATADNPVTLMMSDGSKYTLTDGAYTQGESTPVVTTLTVYDTLGAPHDVTVYFTKVDSKSDTWRISLSTDGSQAATIKEADGSITTVSMADQTLKFDTNGAFVDGSGTPTLLIENGASPKQTISLDVSGLTQYSQSNTVAGKSNGNAAGTLSSISIDKTGTITGTYTNGMKQVEAQVALQRFNNPGGLNKIGESLYEDSNNAGLSGSPNTASALGATITPAALEMSNVDIANEFTDMIITQRGFQGNSKIITVSDEMLETLINMKR